VARVILEGSDLEMLSKWPHIKLNQDHQIQHLVPVLHYIYTSE